MIGYQKDKKEDRKQMNGWTCWKDECKCDPIDVCKQIVIF